MTLREILTHRANRHTKLGESKKPARRSRIAKLMEARKAARKVAGRPSRFGALKRSRLAEGRKSMALQRHFIVEDEDKDLVTIEPAAVEEPVVDVEDDKKVDNAELVDSLKAIAAQLGLEVVDPAAAPAADEEPVEVKPAEDEVADEPAVEDESKKACEDGTCLKEEDEEEEEKPAEDAEASDDAEGEKADDAEASEDAEASTEDGEATEGEESAEDAEAAEDGEENAKVEEEDVETIAKDLADVTPDQWMEVLGQILNQ